MSVDVYKLIMGLVTSGLTAGVFYLLSLPARIKAIEIKMQLEGQHRDELLKKNEQAINKLNESVNKLNIVLAKMED